MKRYLYFEIHIINMPLYANPKWIIVWHIYPFFKKIINSRKSIWRKMDNKDFLRFFIFGGDLF